MHKGQRVETPLGRGFVIGFERFDAKGNWIPDSTEDRDNTSRVHVELDNPSNWIGFEEHGHPYFFRSDLSEFTP